jgi:phosphoesterase RecJ-like protein
VELDGGLCKASLRAVGEGEVVAIARRFGGGGHDKAAGFRFRGSLAETAAALRKEVARTFSGGVRPELTGGSGAP